MVVLTREFSVEAIVQARFEKFVTEPIKDYLKKQKKLKVWGLECKMFPKILRQ